jgi:hypothetical protein
MPRATEIFLGRLFLAAAVLIRGVGAVNLRGGNNRDKTMVGSMCLAQ